MRRRSFLKNSFSAAVPLLLPWNSMDGLFAPPGLIRNVVFIHLSGGNDWYNTIVPYSNESYYQSRPSLAVASDGVLKINTRFGLHPAMSPLWEFWTEGQALLINGITCGHSDNSHYTAEHCWKNVARNEANWLDVLTRETSIKVRSAKQLRCIENTGGFFDDMNLVAERIVQSNQSGVYTVKLDGFDMHQFQKHKHEHLLNEYSRATASFIEHLKSHKKFDDTLVVTWSELGRSFNENNRRGTDHGSENSVMIMGAKLSNAGVITRQDIGASELYGSILEGWLGIDSFKVIDYKRSLNNWL